MAKIELQNQNFDLAHTYCTTILKHSPNLEEPILVIFSLAAHSLAAAIIILCLNTFICVCVYLKQFLQFVVVIAGAVLFPQCR